MRRLPRKIELSIGSEGMKDNTASCGHPTYWVEGNTPCPYCECDELSKQNDMFREWHERDYARIVELIAKIDRLEESNDNDCWEYI
jgi:hypothetical protein